MSTWEFLVGASFFLPTFAAAVFAGRIVLQRRFAYLAGIASVLAWTVLATTALVFSEVLPAALGVLTRGTALATALLTLGAALALRPPLAPTAKDTVRKPPESGKSSLVIAALALASLTVYELARLRGLLGSPLTDIDMLGFHLPGIARWIQTGSVWQVDQFLPGFATAQYPNNGDFIILSAVLPWHDLAFVRLPALFFFLVTAVAVYELALELGSSRAAAATFAAVALVVPPLSQFALDGIPDDITLATLTIGVLFLLRHARTQRRGELLLAGLALGLALGTKWFGLTASAVVVIVWIGAQLLQRRRPLHVARSGGALLGMMALGGGFWFVRNVVESGDPIYPKTVSIFGLQLFAGSHNDVVDRYGYTIVHYLGQPDVLYKYIYPGLRSQLGLAGLVLLVGLVAAIARSLPRWRLPGGAGVLASALVTIGICITYAITPGTAYGPKNQPVEGFVTLRWLTPALVIGAAVCAAWCSSIGRWRVLLELAGLVAVADGIRRGVNVPAGTAVKVGAVLAVAAIAVAVGLRWAKARRRRSRFAALGAATVAIVLIVIGGRLDQRSFDRHTYAAFDPVFAWIDLHAPTGHTIGVTGGTGGTPGLSPTLPLFGPRLGNRVTYVGETVVHSVELPTKQTTFQDELRRGRYDLLAIGLPYAGQTDAWARALRFPLLARSSRIALYAVPASVRTRT